MDTEKVIHDKCIGIERCMIGRLDCISVWYMLYTGDWEKF